MLTPKDIIKLEDDKYSEEKLVQEIDESILNNFEKFSYQEADLNKIVPLRIRNKIAAKYARCGWTYVYHVAGNERFDGFGKTTFYFSKEVVNGSIMDKFFLVQMSKVDYNKFVVYKDDKLVEEFELDGE